MTPREWCARLLGVFAGRRRERELQDELAFHRDMLEAGHRDRGLDGDAARRAAALALGGQAQITEAWRDQRGLPFLDMLVQDVRYGIRVLRRTPGFALAALLTLAIGIGANAAIFSVVDAVLLQPLPYTDPDRLVTIGDRNADGSSSNVGFTTMVDWRARSRSFEGLGVMRSWQPTLMVNGEAERVSAVRVSADYFDMLGVWPALGRNFSAADDHPDRWRVLLLSDGLWRRRFNADPGIVGRSIVMNDRQYQVIGVMPAGFEPVDSNRLYDTDAEMWAPLGYQVGGDSACRSCQHLRGFGRLKRGVSIAAATAEMNTIRAQLRREYPADYGEGSIAIVSLREALTGGVRNALLVLLGAVSFVLLIACANVANLLIARSVGRQRELTMRAALGADRGRIVRQLLTESLLLSVLGAIAGVALAYGLVNGITSLAPVSLPRLAHVRIDGRVLAFTAMLGVLTGIVFGLVPAWRGASGTRAALAVDARGTAGGRGRARAALVVADLALALVLLAGAGLMLRTVSALMRTSPGFQADRVLAIDFSLVGRAYAEDGPVRSFQQELVDKLRAIPGVESVSIADQIPFGGNFDCRGFHVNGRMKAHSSEDPCIERYGITPGYHEMLGIPLVAGRTINDADTTTSQPVVLISTSTARLVFGSDSPLGAQVRLGDATEGPWRTIVGVVGDVHHDDVTGPPRAAVYTPQTQFTDSFLVALVKVATDDPMSVAGPARQAIRSMDPNVPVYRVATLPSLVADASAHRTFVMRLLGGFALVAVLLAAIGLYGVVSYGVALRTREVGVRMALGARRSDVLRLVLSGGAKLVAWGLAAGLAGAAASTRLMGTLVFGVSPIDPLTFTAAVLVLVAVALLAHWIPIRRALRIDPALALRAE